LEIERLLSYYLEKCEACDTTPEELQTLQSLVKQAAADDSAEPVTHTCVRTAGASTSLWDTVEAGWCTMSLVRESEAARTQDIELVAVPQKESAVRQRYCVCVRMACTLQRKLAGAAWGNLHATFVHFMIGMSWYLGALAEQMKKLYAKLYSDAYH